MIKNICLAVSILLSSNVVMANDLLGVDLNNDGIRDGLEEIIKNYNADDLEMQNLAMLTARHYQNILSLSKNGKFSKSASDKLSKDTMILASCMFNASIVNEKFDRVKSEKIDINRILIKGYIFDTPERFKVYDEYNYSRNGKSQEMIEAKPEDCMYIEK